MAAAMLAGCGGKVVVDAAGTGGAGTGGAAQKICGGEQGLQCGPGELCRWAPPGSCGNADGTGICTPKPGGACPADCPGVCGCDGLPYCNACEANAAGVDVSATSNCTTFDAGPPDAEYAAFGLPTALPRYIVTKTDFAGDRCFLVVVAGGIMPSFPEVQVTMGWNVEAVAVTPHATDCALDANVWPPKGEVVQAIAAKGIVKHDSASFPCFVSLDLVAAFPGGPPWVPPDVSFQAEDLVIQGVSCSL